MLGRNLQYLTLAVCALTLAACDPDPTSPELTQGPQYSAHEGAALSPMSGTIALSALVDPGTRGVNPGGVRKIDGQSFVVALTGTLVGQLQFVEKQSLNARGSGASRGAFDGEVSYAGMNGTISGVSTAVIKDRVSRGRFVARGEGGLEGFLFHFELVGPLGGPFHYTGTVVATPAR